MTTAFQSDAFQVDAFQIDACVSAFQSGAFQSNAFQICVNDTGPVVTIRRQKRRLSPLWQVPLVDKSQVLTRLHFNFIQQEIVDSINGTTGSSNETAVNLGFMSIVIGTGSPEGVISGSPPDLYLNRNGGAGTTLYVKESGSASNAGWIAK